MNFIYIYIVFVLGCSRFDRSTLVSDGIDCAMIDTSSLSASDVTQALASNDPECDWRCAIGKLAERHAASVLACVVRRVADTISNTKDPQTISLLASECPDCAERANRCIVEHSWNFIR